MIKIDIEEVETKGELVAVLDIIKEQVQKGYTSGVYPTWDLSGEEERESKENE